MVVHRASLSSAHTHCTHHANNRVQFSKREQYRVTIAYSSSLYCNIPSGIDNRSNHISSCSSVTYKLFLCRAPKERQPYYHYSSTRVTAGCTVEREIGASKLKTLTQNYLWSSKFHGVQPTLLPPCTNKQTQSVFVCGRRSPKQTAKNDFTASSISACTNKSPFDFHESSFFSTKHTKTETRQHAYSSSTPYAYRDAPGTFFSCSKQQSTTRTCFLMEGNRNQKV